MDNSSRYNDTGTVRWAQLASQSVKKYLASCKSQQGVWLPAMQNKTPHTTECAALNAREEYDGFMEKIGVSDFSAIFFS